MKEEETIGRPYGVPLLTKKGLEGLGEEGGGADLWDGEQLGHPWAAGSACEVRAPACPRWGQGTGCQMSVRMGRLVVWGAHCYRLKEVWEKPLNWNQAFSVR